MGQVVVRAGERDLSGEHFDQFLRDLSWGLTQAKADDMVADAVKGVLAKHEERYDAFRLIADKIGLLTNAADASTVTRRDAPAATLKPNDRLQELERFLQQATFESDPDNATARPTAEDRVVYTSMADMLAVKRRVLLDILKGGGVQQ